MSSRELKTTQMIADVATSISAQTGLALEEALNFVYNSENLDRFLSSDVNNSAYSDIESTMMNELRCPMS